jgi:Electron transfer DM13
MRAGRSRRGMVLAGLVTLVLVAAGAVAWFQPQKLFIDERVDEAAAGTVTLASGRFRSLGHETSGRAAVLEADAGRRFLRLEALRTSNGPDLFVYLSATPADGPRDAFDDEFLSLGRLKANQGNQNYEIDAGTRLDRYRSVVIWCRRFTYAFGAAELAPAR